MTFSNHLKSRLSLIAVLALVFVTTPALAQFSASFMKPEETEKIADGLYAFRQGAYRSIFLVTDDGVIVTDPVNVKFAAAYRKEIAKITDKPVKYVVYSQSIWDRIKGGQIFKDEGAQFIAQEGCLENLKETPHPDVVMPDITFSDTYKVELGGKSLDLYYVGAGYDTCQAIIVPQPANMIFINNSVNPPRAMFPWNPTIPNLKLHNLIPYFHGIEELAAREGIDTIIGGFIAFGVKDGKPFLEPATGSIEAVTEQRIFWEKLFAAVKAEHEAGTPPKEIVNKINLEEFSGYPLYSKRNMGILIRRVASLYNIGR